MMSVLTLSWCILWFFAPYTNAQLGTDLRIFTTMHVRTRSNYLYWESQDSSDQTVRLKRLNHTNPDDLAQAWGFLPVGFPKNASEPSLGFLCTLIDKFCLTSDLQAKTVKIAARVDTNIYQYWYIETTGAIRNFVDQTLAVTVQGQIKLGSPLALATNTQTKNQHFKFDEIDRATIVELPPPSIN